MKLRMITFYGQWYFRANVKDLTLILVTKAIDVNDNCYVPLTKANFQRKQSGII